MPIIPQTLGINNSRAIRAKSFNLHTIRKLAEYSSKINSVKDNIYSYRFWELMPEVRSVLSPSQRGAKNEKVKKQNYFFGDSAF